MKKIKKLKQISIFCMTTMLSVLSPMTVFAKTITVDGTTYDSSDGYFEAYGKVYNINDAQKNNFVAERNWQEDNIFGYLFDDLYAIPTFDYTNEDGYFVTETSEHGVLDPSFVDENSEFYHGLDYEISKSELEGKRLYIGDNVFDSISDFTFADTGLIGELVLPDSIHRIDEYAFKNTKLTDVTIPSSVTYIDEAVFYMCDDLKTITLDNVKITNDIGNSVHFPTLYTKNGTGEPISKLEPNVVYNDVLSRKANTFRVKYLDTDATSGTAPDLEDVDKNSEYKIQHKGTLSKSGYECVGWNDGKNTYKCGETITVTEDMTLTPVWEVKTNVPDLETGDNTGNTDNSNIDITGNGSGDSVNDTANLSNETNDSVLKTPVDSDSTTPKSKRPTVLRSIVGAIVAGGVVIGLTVTDTFKKLYLALLLLLFKKKRVIFKGIIENDNSAVKVEGNKDENTLNDIISTYHTVPEIIDCVKVLNAKTVFPPFTKMLISHVDANGIIENTFDANEEKMYDLLSEASGNVTVTLYNATYNVECELNFNLK